ncbi:MAG: hypothetical protein ABFD69_07485 [Candidatus Sumerlaeia bacterium]
MKLTRLVIVLLIMAAMPTTSRALETLIGPVGINATSPRCALDVSDPALNTAFCLSKANSTVNYFMVQTFGAGALNLDAYNASSIQIEFNPRPADGVGAAYFKFFRNTNTTGQTSLDFCRGDGTNTIDSRIGVKGTNTFFTNTHIGINTKNPSSSYWLDVIGPARTGNLVTSGTLSVSGAVSTGALTANGTLNVTGEATVPVINITGGSDLSEKFNVNSSAMSPEAGMIVCIDPANAGELKVSTKAYDRTVAGVISGAGGVKTGMVMGQTSMKIANGDLPVALTGRVYCMVDASNGAILPGDLLTTSNVPGHAMKVTNHSKASGAIIGKAMTSLEKGRGLVLVLVTLQ